MTTIELQRTESLSPRANYELTDREKLVRSIEKGTCTTEDLRKISSRQIDKINHDSSLRRRIRKALVSDLYSGHIQYVLEVAALCMERNIRYEVPEEKSITPSVLNTALKHDLKNGAAKLLAKTVECDFVLPINKNDFRELVLIALKEGYFNEKNDNARCFLGTQIDRCSNPTQFPTESREDFQQRMELLFEITRETIKRKIPISGRPIERTLMSLRNVNDGSFTEPAIILLNELWDYVPANNETCINPYTAQTLTVCASQPGVLDSDKEEIARSVVRNACTALERFHLNTNNDGRKILNPTTFEMLARDLKHSGLIEEAILLALSCERYEFHLTDLTLEKISELAKVVDDENIQGGARIIDSILRARESSNLHYNVASCIQTAA